MNRICLMLLFVIAFYSTVKSQSIEIQLSNYFNITVSKDGSGTTSTIQEAINLVPDGNEKRIVIFIRNGVYKEKILIPSTKKNITLVGENVDKVVLTYNDYSGKVVNGETITTNTSYSFAVEANDFTSMNITFANSAGQVGQAVALRTSGDRQIFYNCKLIGHQDTYYTIGHYRNYLKNCLIEGTTDYIFGRSTVVFEDCQINSLKTGSFITAASTEKDVKFGYVFLNCRFTAAPDVERVFLGRPWRPFARTVIINSFLDEFVNPQGWSVWRGNENHQTCYFAEFGNFGPGADTNNRIDWSHQLTNEEFGKYTISNIFSKSTNPEYFEDSWLPNLENDPIFKIVSAICK